MDHAETESIMNLVLLNPVPPYPGLANAQLSPIEQPPPAYEDPPSYTSVVGHPVGMTVGMITQIVPVQANQQQADAGALGRIRKAYARAKKWALRLIIEAMFLNHAVVLAAYCVKSRPELIRRSHLPRRPLRSSHHRPDAALDVLLPLSSAYLLTGLRTRIIVLTNLLADSLGFFVPPRP
ncbi:hypothetical protein B0H12DRAFT_1240367 [Mycena haematopus]|nr:hypothetical protein B0H12DRAFT_1241523 [Mycena haematopus]KAJ7228030.1 hypothetical protein B0H12DRAFT_1240367 [Mycena haematopus]